MSPRLDPSKRYFTRLTLGQRIQHWVLLGSFSLLTITGIPMRFPEVGWLDVVYTAMGGLPVARLIHRIAAVAMILDGLAHIVYLIQLLIQNKGRIRQAWPMIPTMKDARDWWETSLYYFGLQKELPRYDRFNFREKFDYFAVFWGLPVMMFSGLVLWFPVYFGNMLPDIAIGMAYIAHSDEAILAISAIVVWHFYNVHYNPDKFPASWIWWHGQISEDEIRHEHPLEYERLLERETRA
ncbi:MAG: cytochrome b/b6 domain-containing protein [Ignavibacteriae bacterium]|nr:cytochrome b/b6 domain-containing protein [Ignavibacteriota bacterium]